MTETAETTVSHQVSDSDGLSPTTEGGSTGESTNKGLAEARDRYRGERDAARNELTAAQALIEKYQRAEVERLSAELAQPSDLFEVGGASLVDLLSESGDVDDAAVVGAVAALIEARPGLAKNPRQPAVDPTQGLGGSGASRPSFSGLFR
ncbi:hypothetical protein [Mycobacterium marinum]|uniref:hypothetical protein n=1 Tax=Mycobacterium marinum TaxID=1781 RepID=UPI00356556E9